jgi:uncharacterized integral membrane protein (TIGR00698 family)
MNVSAKESNLKRPIFLVAIAFCTILLVVHPLNPGFALVMGFLISLIPRPPSHASLIGRLSKRTLAWSIVGFGLTVNIVTIGDLIIQYFWPTISGIAVAISAAVLCGRFLGVDALLSALIGSGTAICGASAIASVSTATKATSEKTSMALAVVLILNSVALFVFPAMGHWLHLSSVDFAVWAALAVHDTSSVVGAAMSYDQNFVEVATTVKLARAIWIAPLTMYFAYRFAPGGKASSFNLPWFIWGYLLAATVSSFCNISQFYHDFVVSSARTGFMLGIFYVGGTIQVSNLRNLGFRPFLLGVLLWVLSAGWSLAAILYW